MSDDLRPVLRLGHSPDPDDAFMWWPLFGHEGDAAPMDTGRFRYTPFMADIEQLNKRSSEADGDDLLEITAMSCAQYPHVQHRYELTACGWSLGVDYGPKLVSRKPMTLADLKRPEVVMAVPGERTSAFAVTSLILGKGAFRYKAVPFDQIIQRVVNGEFDAGLVIHEGQLTFEQEGLRLIQDVGKWWTGRFGLPLPLGANAIRRDLDSMHGAGTTDEVAATLRRSVEFALAHRKEAVGYALRFARDMGEELADRFIELYANKWSLDFGERGHQAITTFLRELHVAGLVPEAGPIRCAGAC